MKSNKFKKTISSRQIQRTSLTDFHNITHATWFKCVAVPLKLRIQKHSGIAFANSLIECVTGFIV